MPLFEVVGKAFKVVPLQTPETGLNVGVTLELTVILKVVVVAHCPALGVKVYVVVVVLFKAGDHVPVIPLFDVVCKSFKVSPEQIGFTSVNVGVTFGFIVMLKVVAVAHCPTLDVKV